MLVGNVSIQTMFRYVCVCVYIYTYTCTQLNYIIYIYIYITLTNIVPKFKPIDLKEHTCKQGHDGDIVPRLPMRSMLCGPSGSGKAVLLTNMILDN